MSLFSISLAWTTASSFAGSAARVTALCLITAVSIVCGTGAQVDQENWDDDPRNSGWATAQQEFTPSLNVLDSVQLLMAGQKFALVWPGGPAFVNIRQDGVNGPIIAASEPTFAPPGYDGTMGFGFAKPVPLVPGQVYALEPVTFIGSPGHLFGGPFGVTPSRYAGGRFFGAGQFVEADLIFREGVGLAVVPEPSPALLLATGLGLALAQYMILCGRTTQLTDI
jgi:hypothetical protein